MVATVTTYITVVGWWHLIKSLSCFNLEKILDLTGSRTMPPPGLQIYIWPHVTVTFDLLHPNVDQHHPTGSETTPPYAPRSSRFGSEPPSVEDDVNVWRYAILELHARNDDDPNYCDIMDIYCTMCLSSLAKICGRFLRYLAEGFLWPISVSCDPELWPPNPQSWPFRALVPWTLVPICIKTGRLIFKISCSQASVTDTQTNWMDEWTNWEHNGICWHKKLPLQRNETIRH